MEMMREVSAIALFNTKGEVFLQNREGISKYGEERSFFGGGIESGESKEECIIRESKEELGISIKIDDLVELGMYEHQIDGKKYIRNLYILTTPISGEHLHVNEGKEGVFYQFDKANELVFMHDVTRELSDCATYINDYLNNNR